MVTHNCHGKTKNLTAKTKYLTAKPKTSRQNKTPHGKTKNIYKEPRQDSGQRNISYTRYPKKCFTQTYRVLYGDAILVLTWMSSNMAQKPAETSVTEFCYKSVNLFFEKLLNIKVILFLIHELFR